jgi:hypothetical protein
VILSLKNMAGEKGRVLLAYSGGLGESRALVQGKPGFAEPATDTSCILAWLIEQGYEAVAFSEKHLHSVVFRSAL